MSNLYGVIDIGSNTVRLVIYSVNGNNIQAVLKNKYMAGLAGYINSNGRMSKEGIREAVNILKELRMITDQITLQEILPFGTAPLRNITNSDEVLSILKKKTGFDINVLTGKEEAQYDYYGALRSTSMKTGLITDVGGGSTELVYFQDRKLIDSVSMPIGSLNMYTKYIDGILPSRPEIRHIRANVDECLKDTGFCPDDVDVDTMCAIGGTARTAHQIASYVTGSTKKYQPDFFDDYLSQICNGPGRITNRLLRIAPDRIHTITPGITILSEVCSMFGIKNIVTSPYGVREGYLYYHLKKEGKIDD